jgi:hypothetical protein
MTDPLERVLELVASGRLTAEEAAPILDALEARAAENAGRDASAPGTDADAPGQGGGQAAANARYARVEVRESGRRVVDLRVPISLGRFALSRVPGLSSQQIADVEEAVTSGAHGPILDVQDADGDGVRIILE